MAIHIKNKLGEYVEKTGPYTPEFGDKYIPLFPTLVVEEAHDFLPGNPPIDAEWPELWANYTLDLVNNASSFNENEGSDYWFIVEE